MSDPITRYHEAAKALVNAQRALAEAEIEFKQAKAQRTTREQII